MEREALASLHQLRPQVERDKPVLTRENPYLERQGLGRDTDTAGKILLKTKGKAEKTKEKSRVIFQKLSY